MSTSIIVPWTVYQEFWSRIKQFYITHEYRHANYADITYNGLDYRVQQADFLDAGKRVAKFMEQEGRPPKTVTLTATPLKPTKSELHLRIEEAIGGVYETATEMYNLFKANEDYDYYYNDIYPQGEAIRRLKEGKPLNCSDFSQIGYAGLKDLGYTVRYKHVKCIVSGKGHVFLQVKGKELGENWIAYDLASATASNYSLGKAWCIDGKLVAYDPAWLLSDDGKT